MWQSGLAHDLLAGTESTGIRPVIRACMPVEPTRQGDWSPMAGRTWRPSCNRENYSCRSVHR